MRFGHMRTTAHFLCNADKKVEEEGGGLNFNGEETKIVTGANKKKNLKKKDVTTQASDRDLTGGKGQ